MVEHYSHALILKCTPYGENNQIVTLFTPQLGKIGAFSKGGSPSLQPLSLIEALFSEGKGDLYRLIEPRLLDPHLLLRQSFASLKASLQMADFLLRFYPDRLEKPHIFALLNAYLKKLPTAKNPENYYYSFLLKTLHVEGLVDLDPFPQRLLPLITAKKWEEIETIALTMDEKEQIDLLEHH